MEKLCTSRFIISCIALISGSIICGCSSTSKNASIIEVQKRRIKKLEKHIGKQRSQMNRLKHRKWLAAERTPNAKRENFRELDRRIKKRHWVQALQLSANLKKKYPNSRELSRRRVHIFRKMGLQKQAQAELQSVRERNIGKKRSRSQHKRQL